MSSNRPVVTIDDIEFTWPGAVNPVLKIDSFELGEGERLFVKGASGSGKSTLLSLVAGINVATSGSIKVLGLDIKTMSGRARDRFRADHLGIIFQQFNLLPYLCVIENVLLPCRFSVLKREKVGAEGGLIAEGQRLLRHLDIDDELHYKPVNELSVGQQQRVAAARALIGRPALVIADEPTSSLDADRRKRFVELLFRECEQEGAALMFVSHDASLEPLFDRPIHLDEINEVT